MIRPRRIRRISLHPKTKYFKPAGVPLRDLEEIVISFEEFEALRLKDLLGKEQKEAAIEMNISQSTFHRMIAEMHKKIAEALIDGKAIKIEGGNFIMKKKHMKIAVSSYSDNIEKEVSDRFARASYFLIVDLNEKDIVDIKTIKNEYKDAQGGAGIAVAEMVAKQNVDAVITGNIGPRALDLLNQFNIPVYKFNGSINDAIKNFVDEKLIKIKR